MTRNAYEILKNLLYYGIIKKTNGMSIMDRKFFDNELNLLLTKAEGKIPDENLPDLPFMESVPDVHDWYMFEHELWKIGDEIRQLILMGKKALTQSQIDRIINICLDERAKRGRQSFVLLLGKKVYQKYSDKIAPLLDSDDIDGQVIDTLYKMQAGQYVDLIRPFMNHKRTWIKNTAKKYVQKYQ